MDKQQAQTIIKETFEKSFNRDRFNGFIKNLLNQIEDAPFSYQGNYIPDAYKPFISKYERIGKYNDGEKRIDILIVYLNRKTSIERARTSQRNFIAGYLDGKYGSDVSKDAALVAFVSPNEEDWRFSLVKMDYRFEQAKNGKIKVKEEFTPARRWSFLVGNNESSHTAQSRLVPVLTDDQHDPTLAQMEEAFNIEKVTKEFFGKYRELFLWTQETLDKIVEQDNDIQADFEKKGVNTVDFAKKLLGQIVFLYFLQKKGWFGVERDAEWGTGTKQFLRELFQGRHGQYGNFFNDILEPLFYEALRIDRRHDDNYYSRFNCQIPFLNGGLFDPIAGYDWVHTDILLPNELFSNQNKTKEGDTGNGILDIFDRYNFTVKEDEPLEKEVAVDPEMLGKVFENLLEVKDRKSKGSYYTPREIVHYMCQQSLINYLNAELNKGVTLYQNIGDIQTNAFGNEAKVGQLDLTVKHKSGTDITKEDIEILIKYGEQFGENEATVEVKGGKTDTYSYKLPESIRRNAKLIDEKLAIIKVCDPAIGSGAFPVGMMYEIVKTRNVLSAYINDPDRTIYNFKRECIEKSLYGVDIDPGAVEIAKLRLWLSLVVDEEDIKQIKPLPNLDYKIVCGNSLLGVEKNLFNRQLFGELERLKPLLFNETNPTRKHSYKQQIDDLISQITHGHKEFDFEVYFSEVFHEKGGFDAVIANPPYVSALKLKKLIPEKEYSFLKQSYETAKGTVDLYIYFFEKGIKLLKESGSLAYISPNRYLSASYGKALRKYIYNNASLASIIDYSDVRVFKEASTYPILSFLTKGKKRAYKIFVGKYSEDSKIYFKTITSQKLNFNEDLIWGFLLNDKIQITEKVISQSVPLHKICKINATSTASEADEYHCLINEKGGYKLINTGTIDRYKTTWGVEKLTDKGRKYLHPCLPSVSSRICSSRHHLYSSPKIVFAKIALTAEAFYDSEGEYASINTNCLHAFSDEVDPRYILSWVNSRLFQYTFECFFDGLKMQGGYLLYSSPNLSSMFIKKGNKQSRKPFIALVDRIVGVIKDDDYLQNPQKQSQVKALEREIDHMVYHLHGLTEKEIGIVEGDE